MKPDEIQEMIKTNRLIIEKKEREIQNLRQTNKQLKAGIANALTAKSLVFGFPPFVFLSGSLIISPCLFNFHPSLGY